MRFQRIQMLRFAAAAAVVLLHAQATVLRYLPPQDGYAPLFYGGFGVDLFFVISGFIIRVTIEREPTAGLFLRRRIERVAPLYWLCTLAFAALVTVGGIGRDAADPGDVGQRLGLSLGFLAWTNAYDPRPLIYLGWSLEFEMLFYLATTSLLLWTRRPVLPLTVLLGGSVLVGAFTGAETGTAAQLFLCNPLLMEFLFGLLVAEILLGRRPWAALAIMSAVLILGVPWAGWGWRVWFIGVPSAALVGLAAWLDRRELALASPTRWAARLGDASYAIYLVQVFTISGVCKLAVRVAPGLPLPALILVITMTTIAAGYGLFLLVERPIGRWTHRRRGGRDLECPLPSGEWVVERSETGRGAVPEQPTFPLSLAASQPSLSPEGERAGD